MKVLHFGCGPVLIDGWTNVDRLSYHTWPALRHAPEPGQRFRPNEDDNASDAVVTVHDNAPWIADIRHGLPFPDNAFDAVVTVHALQALTWPELLPALRELRRVTRIDGTLRLVVPDLDKNIDAWLDGNADHFTIDPGDATSLDGRFCLALTCRGDTRSLFTAAWTRGVLERTGWRDPVVWEHGQSGTAEELTLADNRPAESLFMEAQA